jgi:hypothetical protein
MKSAEIFSGTEKEDIARWLNSVELVFIENKVPEATRISYALMRLRGGAAAAAHGMLNKYYVEQADHQTPLWDDLRDFSMQNTSFKIPGT